jgi:hypothetical protein
MTMTPLVLLLLTSILASAISFQLSCMPSKDMNVRNDRLSLHVSASRSKWDELIDEDEDDAMQFNGGPPVPRDMKYTLINIKRQRENYDSIRMVSGIELINDVYCRDAETSVFWFVGKVARVSDVTIEKAIARQWGLIEEHSARLRPVELYPKWGSLELWIAPGDSELDVAYSKPEIVFVQMFRDVENTDKVRNAEIGFAGELYENDEDVGFRTTRTADGKAMREIKSSVGQRQPSDKEMDDLMEILNSQVAADGVDQ